MPTTIADILAGLQAAFPTPPPVPAGLLKKHGAVVDHKPGPKAKVEASHLPQLPTVTRKVAADLGITRVASDPSAPSCVPWIDANRIRASCARDVLERLERGMDDRTFEQRSADATRARAITVAAQRVKWRFTFSPKAAAKPRPKVERTAEERERHREYMRAYMRESRARQKADALVKLQDA